MMQKILVRQDDASIIDKLTGTSLDASRAIYRGNRGFKWTNKRKVLLTLVAQGLTNREISQVVGITENTVKKHLTAIYVGLGAANGPNAVYIAAKTGLIE